MLEAAIPEDAFKNALINGETIPDGEEVIWREKDGVRVVIIRHPTPFKGAMLVTTVYRVQGPARGTKR